jgi:excinuclease ABC subunit A
MCPTTGLAYDEPAPHSFSFNSPQGACPHCKGLGVVSEISIDKIIPDKSLSIREGAILPLGKYKNSLIFWQLEAIGKKHHFDLDTPIKKISQEALKIILYGSNEQYHIEHSPLGYEANFFLSFEGIINYIENFGNSSSLSSKQSKWIARFYSKKQCPVCHGKRLKKESLHFKIDQKSIADISEMELSKLAQWIQQLPEKLSHTQKTIATEILIEIEKRLQFLLNVGLEYLSLNRPTGSLSGGEAQRIRLATQIGSQLINTLYILDEPSIGLHQRDNNKLIKTLISLRDLGNTVIVVEHDTDTIATADHVLDIGPGAGVHGGEIIYSGPVPGLLDCKKSLTGGYLSGRLSIPVPNKRRKIRKGARYWVTVKGATVNNLHNLSVRFPLGVMTCVTGVSGSGKSSLVIETLFKEARRFLQEGAVGKSMLKGRDNIDKVIDIDQSPIGRTPRSNPATYTGVLTPIRELLARLPESRARGYKIGRFSFNIKGGRCEACEGDGVIKIAMHFLPDIYVTCERCQGKRYNRETLDIKYRGKNIADILAMTVEEALDFFQNIPPVKNRLQTVYDVGLGYITLGQSSVTLSGGEAQRVKLARELTKRSTGRTLYILDEPTTGLHPADIQHLLVVLGRLVDSGNSVVVIEHNLDVIKTADYIIDIGPEGGDGGGNIVAAGTPEEVAAVAGSYTGMFLKQTLELEN